MEKYSVLILSALTITAWITRASAQDQPLSDYKLAIESTSESKQDFQQLRNRLLKRYDPMVEQLRQSETK